MLLRNLVILIENEGTLFILYVIQNPENCSGIKTLYFFSIFFLIKPRKLIKFKFVNRENLFF